MILFVDQTGAMGGAQTVLLSLLGAALDLTSEVAVLAPGGGALEVEIRRRFAQRVNFIACEEPVLQRGSKGLGDMLAILAYAWRFRRHIKLLRAQRVVYVNGNRQLPVFLLLAPFFRRGTVYHIHTEYGRLEKFAIRMAAWWPTTRAIVSNSHFIAVRLGVPSTVIENCLDEQFATLSFKDRFQNAQMPYHAAVIGTLALQKGQDIALQASKGLPLTLHLVGAPASNSESLVAMLEREGAQMEGVTANVPATLDRLGIQFNLVPSVCDEAFGLAAIEGMACSAITIVSGRGGLAQIASRTGALTAASAGALGDLLKQLCDTPKADLVALGRSQHQATLVNYSPDRFRAQITDLLKCVLTNR